MKKFAKYFALGLGGALGVTLGATLPAKIDVREYQSASGRQKLTKQDAYCYSACANSAGIWAGEPEKLSRTCFGSDKDNQYYGHAVGLILAPINEVPKNAVLKDVIDK